LAALLAMALTFRPLLAQEETESKAKPADPTGTWKWERAFNDNNAEFTLKLNWNGKELTGKYSAFDNTSDIERAKLEKDQISFIAQREFNGNQFEVKFDGKVQDDSIIGTIAVDFGDGEQEFDWEAKRTIGIDDVVGVWDISLETPDGAAITPRITITKADGDKLEGRSESDFGEFELTNIAIKDNVVSWEISREQDDRSFKVVYKGKPRGNAIEGETEYDFDGNTGTMKFTGKRTPPDEKKAKPAGEEQAKPDSADDTTTSADSTTQSETPAGDEPDDQ
jgi:hypothetical protein